jgi:hypothetical protein
MGCCANDGDDDIIIPKIKPVETTILGSQNV